MFLALNAWEQKTKKIVFGTQRVKMSSECKVFTVSTVYLLWFIFIVFISLWTGKRYFIETEKTRHGNRTCGQTLTKYRWSVSSSKYLQKGTESLRGI